LRAPGRGHAGNRRSGFDAPGNDNENLKEEWIAIRNEGAVPVDVTGWGIKDESASHRYRFPASFTLFPGETVTVRTGCGTDFGTDLHWYNVGSAVWNNSGDTAFSSIPTATPMSPTPTRGDQTVVDGGNRHHP
jgi:hypothetical protein